MFAYTYIATNCWGGIYIYVTTTTRRQIASSSDSNGRHTQHNCEFEQLRLQHYNCILSPKEGIYTSFVVRKYLNSTIRMSCSVEVISLSMLRLNKRTKNILVIAIAILVCKSNLFAIFSQACKKYIFKYLGFFFLTSLVTLLQFLHWKGLILHIIYIYGNLFRIHRSCTLICILVVYKYAEQTSLFSFLSTQFRLHHTTYSRTLK